MLILLSPAKTLDIRLGHPDLERTFPNYVNKANTITGYLKKLPQQKLEEMMKISSRLAWLAQERMALWQTDPVEAQGGHAIFSYKGEVYHGLDSSSMGLSEVEAAQQHLRILSAMYGVLRPLDLIQPYRLEMGAPWSFGKYQDLYHFWKTKITRQIAQNLKESGSNVLINLASHEYFSALDHKKLNANIITPQFLENRDDGLKCITVYTKKARGLLARYILENLPFHEEEMEGFSSEGYFFNHQRSKPGAPVFTR